MSTARGDGDGDGLGQPDHCKTSTIRRKLPVWHHVFPHLHWFLTRTSALVCLWSFLYRRWLERCIDWLWNLIQVELNYLTGAKSLYDKKQLVHGGRPKVAQCMCTAKTRLLLSVPVQCGHVWAKKAHHHKSIYQYMQVHLFHMMKSTTHLFSNRLKTLLSQIKDGFHPATGLGEVAMMLRLIAF